MYEGAAASPSLPRIIIKNSPSQESRMNALPQESQNEPSPQHSKKNGESEEPKADDPSCNGSTNHETPKSQKSPKFRISEVLSRATGAIPKRTANLKGSFENPLYPHQNESSSVDGQSNKVSASCSGDATDGQDVNRAEDKVEDERNRHGELVSDEKEGRLMRMYFKPKMKAEKDKIDGNRNRDVFGDGTEDRMMKMSFKAKPKKPDGFSNPLYGLNAGPAELDVSTLEYDTEVTPSNKTEDKMATGAIGNGQDPEMGFGAKMLRKLKRGDADSNGKSDTTREDKKLSKFMHM